MEKQFYLCIAWKWKWFEIGKRLSSQFMRSVLFKSSPKIVVVVVVFFLSLMVSLVSTEKSSKKLVGDVTTYDRILILHLWKSYKIWFVHWTHIHRGLYFILRMSWDKSKEIMSNVPYYQCCLLYVTVMSVAMEKCFPTPHRFKVMWNRK